MLESDKVYLLNKNNLPTFMEEFIGAAAKTLDKLDFADNDGWLSTIPFGKLAGFLVKQFVEISNEHRALSHAVGFACSAAFTQAVVRTGLKPVIKKDDYDKFEKKLKTLVKDKTTEIGAFDLDNFWESPLVKQYVNLFTQLLQDAEVDRRHQIRIKNFMRDYSRLSFVRLLRDQETVYGKVNQLIGSELYESLKEKHKLDTYRAALKNQYTELTLNDEQGMTLDSIYQEPDFRIFVKCLKKGDYQKDKNAFVSARELGIDDNIHGFTDKWLRGNLQSEFIRAQSPRLVLLYGYPGQGKTSFCKRLIYDLLGEQEIEKDVYMVRLRNIGEPHDLKSDVLNTINDHLQDKHGFKPRQLEQSMLILDGLDELLMKNKLKAEDVEEIFKNIRNCVIQKEQIQIILTSRFGYLNLEKLPAANFLVLQLEEFDLTIQKEWLRKYLQFHESWLNEEKLEQINGSDSHLKDLVGQPILLHMVATLDEHLDQDANRAKVYEQLFNQITNPKKWKKDQISVLEGLESDLLRKALQEMAYEIWQSGDGYIHKSKIRELDSIKEIEEKLTSADQFQDVLKIMMVAFYFQEVNTDHNSFSSEDTNQYAIEFLHKSLQEYLTAEYIWNEVLEEFLAPGRKKQFALHEENQALAVLQGIFGRQNMSTEIQDYLVEIVKNHSEEKDKQDLSHRLGHFFDYLLEKDFLHAYKADDSDHPFQIGTRIFYGFWAIFSHLPSEVNHLETDQRKKMFAAFLRSQGGGHQINLVKCNLSGADLRGADLSGADLRGADLSGADLRRADLSGADLSGADLSGAYLSGAYLRGAYLSGADLSGAYLSGAYLSGAYLRGADLSGADLRRADLRGIHKVTPEQFLKVPHLEHIHGLSQAFISKILALRAREGKGKIGQV